jgi:hypothetical protein
MVEIFEWLIQFLFENRTLGIELAKKKKSLG